MPNGGIDQAFRSGELLLGQEPSGEGVLQAATTPLAVMILIAVFVVAAILLLKRFLSILPELTDSVFRARGSASLENSVRSSHDRNLIALVLVIPMILVTYRYRLYDATFLRDLAGNWRVLAVAGVITAWLLLRLVMYFWLKPRRRYDFYQLSRRLGFTYWILLSILVLLTIGILALSGTSDSTVRLVIYVEILAVYLVFLLRRAQILSISCNPVRTFLYLCGLEILPAAALVISAVVL